MNLLDNLVWHENWVQKMGSWCFCVLAIYFQIVLKDETIIRENMPR